ncbi:MAG: AAA family ATPase [Actinomycetota bacterium]
MSTSGGADDGDLRAFARSFATLAQRAHDLAFGDEGAPFAELIDQHLEVPEHGPATVGQDLPAVERPNLQLAVEELSGSLRPLGLPDEVAYHPGFSIAALATGSFRGPSAPVAAVFDDVATGVDNRLRCVRAGVWLAEYDGQPIVIGVFPRERHRPGGPEVRLEVLAASETLSTAVLEALADLRRRHNVYRGQVLAFTFSEFGDFGIEFMVRPTTIADEVILAPDDLASIRRHTVDLAEHADALRNAGQHLRRGLLLYGPPGTGKTHTVGHLMAAMPERTVVVLQGASVGALGHAAAIVKALPPAMLVIEDVDLVAAERSMHLMGGSPLLFQLLNEMDGLAAGDDVIFILTTNRLDLLEPALAARPGRIDHAVHIALPDAAARRRLFELYLGRVEHEVDSLTAAVELSADMPGAFIKEAVRRGVSNMLVDGDVTMTGDHLERAVTEMLNALDPVRAAVAGGPPGMMPPMTHGLAPMPPPSFEG